MEIAPSKRFVEHIPLVLPCITRKNGDISLNMEAAVSSIVHPSNIMAIMTDIFVAEYKASDPVCYKKSYVTHETSFQPVSSYVIITKLPYEEKDLR